MSVRGTTKDDDAPDSYVTIRSTGSEMQQVNWARSFIATPRFDNEKGITVGPILVDGVAEEPDSYVGVGAQFCRLVTGPKNYNVLAGPLMPSMIGGNAAYWTEGVDGTLSATVSFEHPQAQLVANAALIVPSFLIGAFTTLVQGLQLPSIAAKRRTRRLREALAKLEGTRRGN